MTLRQRFAFDNALSLGFIEKGLASIRPVLALQVPSAWVLIRASLLLTLVFVSAPREFILITKQMLYFDRYAKILAPQLNVFSDPRLIMSLAADVQKLRAERAAREGA